MKQLLVAALVPEHFQHTEHHPETYRLASRNRAWRNAWHKLWSSILHSFFCEAVYHLAAKVARQVHLIALSFSVEMHRPGIGRFMSPGRRKDRTTNTHNKTSVEPKGEHRANEAVYPTTTTLLVSIPITRATP